MQTKIVTEYAPNAEPDDGRSLYTRLTVTGMDLTRLYCAAVLALEQAKKAAAVPLPTDMGAAAHEVKEYEAICKTLWEASLAHDTALNATFEEQA